MFSERSAAPAQNLAIDLYIGAPLALMVALLQTTWIHEARWLGVKPNLLLLFAVAWILVRGARQGLALGLLGALVLEVSTGAALGATLLALGVSLGVAALGAANVFRGAWFLKYLVILTATLVHGLVLWTLLSLTGRPLPFWPSLTRIILPEMLLHLPLMAPFYGAVHALESWLQPRTVEI